MAWKVVRHQMRHWATSAILLLLFLAGSAQGSPAVAAQVSPTVSPDACMDRFENDGVASQAKPLVIGETQTHTFCPVRDADWVTFFAKQGRGYSIETSQLATGVDTYLNLFAPDGRTLLATNDDAEGAHGPSRLVFYPRSDGWYFVQAKNQGDIGYPGLQYSISLKQIDLPTSTPPPPASPTIRPLIPSPTQTPFAADLLHPQKGDGGLDVFVAGPIGAMLPDGLELNDSREAAKAVNVGATYKYLNFVPSSLGAGASSGADTDFFTFRAKPGLCYLVQTGDLSSGLDTTVLLWQSVPTKDKWKLVGQSDDAHPGAPDLSSAVRWCSRADGAAVIEVRNYGGVVATDPRGKTYSLSLMVDPPTPTPTRVPPTLLPQQPSTQPGQEVRVQQVPVGSSAQQAPPTLPPARPTATAKTVPSRTAVPPTATPIPASPTPMPSVSVDVVAYIGDQTSTGPNPGDGIVDLPVLLVDVRTNAVIQRAVTDSNGHAQLTWQWRGSVRVAMPAFRWGRTLQLSDFKADTGATVGGSLILQAKMSQYTLPGIYP